MSCIRIGVAELACILEALRDGNMPLHERQDYEKLLARTIPDPQQRLKALSPDAASLDTRVLAERLLTTGL